MKKYKGVVKRGAEYQGLSTWLAGIDTGSGVPIWFCEPFASRPMARKHADIAARERQQTDTYLERDKA